MDNIGRCCQNVYTYPVNRQKAIIAGSVGGFIIIVIVAIVLINSGGDSTVETKVEGRHALKVTPLIVGENNIARNLKLYRKNKINEFNFVNAFKDGKWKKQCKECVTDLESLGKGMIATQVFTVDVPCEASFRDAVSLALEQIDVIERLLKKNAENIILAKASKDIISIFRANKLSGMIGLKGGHMIDSRLAVLRIFYKAGVRIMALTADCDTTWAVSHDFKKNSVNDTGLNDFGKLVISEMNRIGMIVDLSLSSKKTQLDAISLSEAPVILSNVGAYDQANVTQNIDGDVLEQIKKKKGLAMISFDPVLIKSGDVNLTNFIDHLNFLKQKVGEDCVGIGGNFDGFEDKINGLESPQDIPKLFDTLKESGWTIEQLEKLAGNNFLRVMAAVEKTADLKSDKSPSEDYENKATVIGNNTDCYSDWDQR
ncbi:hypothetical protein LSTR_LSTR006683 [Laodelphax striatellus]|uniref:Dipeptidase n=2 Tax=Laodelphax striatellus TaxID=195883 RepID=A0A482X9C8_LAOST|nr:hypothetical protein LSTR_LSTR006683 [Laodelphax striatellus]